eukprot:776700-Rhodomonas_salina.1
MSDRCLCQQAHPAYAPSNAPADARSENLNSRMASTEPSSYLASCPRCFLHTHLSAITPHAYRFSAGFDATSSSILLVLASPSISGLFEPGDGGLDAFMLLWSSTEAGLVLATCELW